MTFHIRIAQRDGPSGKQFYIAPNAGIAIANAVGKSKIPAHGHEHGCVTADFAVAAVAIFTCGANGLSFLPESTWVIQRLHQNGKRVCAGNLNNVRDIEYSAV